MSKWKYLGFLTCYSVFIFGEYQVDLATDTLPDGVDGELRYGISNQEPLISVDPTFFPPPTITLSGDMNPFSVDTEFSYDAYWLINGGVSNYKFLDIPSLVTVSFLQETEIQNSNNNQIDGTLYVDAYMLFLNSSFQGTGSFINGPNGGLKFFLPTPCVFNGNIDGENLIELLAGDLTVESIAGTALWNIEGNLTIGLNDVDFEFNGDIQGSNTSASIKKVGSGAAIFNPFSASIVSSFNGTIDIAEGKLALNSNSSYPSSAGSLYIREDAILEVGGELANNPIEAKFYVEDNSEIAVLASGAPVAPAFQIILAQPIDGVAGGVNLKKSGLGSLVVNGDNGLIQPFNISLNEGDFIMLSGSTLNGSLTSLNGAFFQGYGTVYEDVDISGEIDPGLPYIQEIGSITIGGDFNQNDGSTYLAALKSNGTNSQIIVNGANTQIGNGTTFNFYPVDPLDGYFQGQQFTVMTHNTRVGTYSNVQSFFLGSNGPETIPTITGFLSYLANEVVLNLQIHFPENGSYNQQQVAKALNALIAQNSTVAYGILGSVGFLSFDELLQAYNYMAPQLFKGATLVAQTNAISVQDSLIKRTNYLFESQFCPDVCEDCEKKPYKWTFWLNPLGSILRQAQNDNSYGEQLGYHQTMGGLTAGLDYQPYENFFLGILGGYVSADNKWQKSQGDAVINSGYVGGYLGLKNKRAYATFSYLQGFNGYNEERVIAYGNFENRMQNSHHGSQAIVHLDLGAQFSVENFQVSPFDSITYINQSEDGFKEKGSSLYNLEVDESTSDYMRNELGVNFSRCLTMDIKKILFDFKLSWIREIRTHGSFYTSHFLNTNVDFETGGYFPDRSLLGIGASVAFTASDQIFMKVYYDGEFANHYWLQNIGLQFGVNF